MNQSVMIDNRLTLWWRLLPNDGLKNTLKVTGIGLLLVTLMFINAPGNDKNIPLDKAKLVTSLHGVLETQSPTLNLIARVTAPQRSLLSSELQAKVEQVLIREGERVVKNQLLINLDTKDFELRVTQLSTQLADLDAQIASNIVRQQQANEQQKQQIILLELAENRLARQEHLNNENLLSRNHLDNAQEKLALRRIAYSQARLVTADLPLQAQRLAAQRKNAFAGLQQAQRNLRRCEIRAPYDGVVTDLFVTNGESARAGQELITVYDPASLEVVAPIPSHFLQTLKKQLNLPEKLQAQASINGRLIQLELTRLSAQVNQGSSSVEGFFSFKQVGQIEIGRSLELRLQLPKLDDVLMLPIDAVYSDGHIFVIEKDRLREVPISVVGQKLDESRGLMLLLRSEEVLTNKLILTTPLPQAITGLKVKPL